MAAVLINLRATNGAGKTTVVREIFRASEICRPLYGAALGPRWPEAYQLKFRQSNTETFVLGPYNLPTGGCDRIQPYTLIVPLIEKYAERGHVVFEGVLIAGCWGKVGGLLERWKHHAVVVFLDTALDVCIERVRARRLERGDGRSFNPKRLIAKHRTIARLKQKIESAGLVPTLSVSSERAATVVINLLESNNSGGDRDLRADEYNAVREAALQQR